MRRRVVIRRGGGLNGEVIRRWMVDGSAKGDRLINKMTTVEHRRLTMMVILSPRQVRLSDIVRWSLVPQHIFRRWGRL